MISTDEQRTALLLATLGGDETWPLREMYRALVEEIPAILYINGPEEDSPTIYVSPQTEAILGLPPEAWYDNTWSKHVHPEDVAEMNATYTRFLRHEEVGVDEYRFIRPDGEVIWLQDSVRIIRNEEGRPTFVQGIMVDVTPRKRADELTARQASLMERIEQVGRRFTEILLAGGDLQALLDALADVVSNPVALADAAHQLVGFSSNRGLDDAGLLARWEQHSRRGHVADTTDGCAWAYVRLRDEEWGRLHVLTGSDQVDEIDALAVDRAAAAIGLWLLSRRERASLAESARSELIADLWQGRRWNGQDALARFRSLGDDLSQPVLVGVAVALGTDPGEVAGLDRLLRSAVNHLRRAAADEGVACMAAVVGSICLGIVGLDAGGLPRAVTGRLGDRVQQGLAAELGGRIVSVGISRPGTTSTLRRVLTEATDAAGHGIRSVLASGCYHSEDLGLRNLLARLSDGPELGHFVEDELGALLAHDAKGGAPLIPTLRAYVDNGGRKSDAARVLHLERRSLYYRLARIEAVLDASLDDPSVRLRAQVALQGLDVLRQRGARFVPTPSWASVQASSSAS